MVNFSAEQLRQLRRQKSVKAAEMARRLDISVQQLHRLEKGTRRLTVDMLLRFCTVLNVDAGNLFSHPTTVAITGIINEQYEVLAVPPNSEHSVKIPALVPNIQNLAAVRWEAAGQISRISGHLAFYYVHEGGIPDNAWQNRCLIVREDGSQCVGWLINQDGVTHIDNPDGRTQFNVPVVWASPILAVVSPVVFAD